MGLGDFLKVMLPVSISAASAVAIGALMNYKTYHETFSEINGDSIYTLVDGIISHTSLRILADGSQIIQRYSLLTDIEYTDRNGDWTAETVYRRPFAGAGSEFYDKRYHAQSHPHEFQKANIDMRKQMMRFKPYLR